MVQIHDEHVALIEDTLRKLQQVTVTIARNPVGDLVINRDHAITLVRASEKCLASIGNAKRGYPNSDPAVPEAPGGARR